MQFLSPTKHVFDATVEFSDEGSRAKWANTDCPVFYDWDDVKGTVHVELKAGRPLEHQGILVEFVGVCAMRTDRSQSLEFISLVRDIAPPGVLVHSTSYPFEFARVEKRFESYMGNEVCIRYFIRITIQRRLTDIVRERDIWVVSMQDPPDSVKGLAMEVGIENALHIDFEVQRSHYHLRDVILGKVYFKLVRVRVKSAEVAIVRRETTGVGTVRAHNESTAVAKFEILDGEVVKGETAPIRIFLKGLSLQPTMRDVLKRFSVRWFINLVIYDEDGRRYFKQHEIVLWRKDRE